MPIPLIVAAIVTSARGQPSYAFAAAHSPPPNWVSEACYEVIGKPVPVETSRRGPPHMGSLFPRVEYRCAKSTPPEVPGVGCYDVNGRGPVFNYSASEAGKPGVPPLSAAELGEISRFANQPVNEIRFAFDVSNARKRRIVIFNAAGDVCSGAPAVLNGKCGEQYAPAENAVTTRAQDHNHRSGGLARTAANAQRR